MSDIWEMTTNSVVAGKGLVNLFYEVELQCLRYGAGVIGITEYNEYRRKLVSSLHPSPDTGKSQAVSLIDGMSEEEFNRDRSDENPNVGRKDQEGTWSDCGKEWTPDEASFKAGWDKAKQLLRPEDLDGFDEAAARITELEEALKRIGAIKYNPIETNYSLKAMIDYAKKQARAALSDAS